jgi:hypothetical protein
MMGYRKVGDEFAAEITDLPRRDRNVSSGKILHDLSFAIVQLRLNQEDNRQMEAQPSAGMEHCTYVNFL